MSIGSAVLTRALQKIGEWLPINIGSETLDLYGNGSYFFTAFSGVGYVFQRSDIDASTNMGVLNESDAIGYFSMDANFPAGSKIEVTFQSSKYETLGDPIIPPFSGVMLLKIINLRKKIE